jgi:hypothetical protein
MASTLLALVLAGPLAAQQPDPPKPHRIHLILKDGSYQVVLSYEISGNLVRYVSAERGGAQEEIPLDLVDLDATHKWEKAHAPVAEGDEQGRPPALDPELVKEEEERTALAPFVEPDLRLPLEDSVLAEDEFRGQPELIPLVQTDGDLNHTTSHSVLRKALNPKAASHQMVVLKGTKSYVQLHVDTPVFYLRIGEASAVSTGSAPLVVDTHGASSTVRDPDAQSAESQYVLVRTDVRVDARLISSFNLAALEQAQPIEDVIQMKQEALRGGHWLKLTPQKPLDFGEYALLEVLSATEINLGVWDFGVHPSAPENRDAIKPEPKKRLDLERRRKQSDLPGISPSSAD